MTKTNLPQISVQANKAIDELYHKKCWEIIETAIEDIKKVPDDKILMLQYGWKNESDILCLGCFAGHSLMKYIDADNYPINLTDYFLVGEERTQIGAIALFLNSIRTGSIYRAYSYIYEGVCPIADEEIIPKEITYNWDTREFKMMRNTFYIHMQVRADLFRKYDL